MKNKITLAAAIVLSAILVTSCSIEKRHYRNGFYVNWNKSNDNITLAANEKQTVGAPNETVANSQQENFVETTTAVQDVNEKDVDLTINGNKNELSVTGADQTTVAAPGVKENTVVANKQILKKAQKQAQKSGGDVPKGLLIVLCFLLPWLAVGLATDWDVKAVIINLLWSLTCIGGIIHALIVVNRNT